MAKLWKAINECCVTSAEFPFALVKVVLRVGFVADSWVITIRGKKSATKPILKSTYFTFGNLKFKASL